MHFCSECQNMYYIRIDSENTNKLDPTLPRISKVLCPNSKCETNTKNEKREIIYIRYDDINMKYIYMCSTCDCVWKTDEQK